MSGQKLRIFISHASNGDVESSISLDRWHDLLKSEGFDVLVDRDLPSGRWHPELIRWMMTCHAAVILLGAKAVCNSSWVACEAFLLRARHTLDAGFKIYPVALDNIGIDDIARATQLCPARLCELTIYQQALAPPDRILNELREIRPIDLFPEDLWPFIERLREILNPSLHAALCPLAFEAVFCILQRACPLTDTASLRDLLIHYLAKHEPKDSIRAVRRFSLDRDIRHELLACIASFWINSNSVTQLKDHLRRRSACSLNTGLTYDAAAHFTARWYLARAKGLPLDPDPVSISKWKPRGIKLITISHSVCSVDTDTLLEDISITLETQNGLVRDGVKSRAAGFRQLPESRPIVVLIPPILSKREDERILRELRSRFPNIMWLHLGRHGEPDSTSPWIQEMAPWIEPLLDIDKEAEVLHHYLEEMDDLMLQTDELRELRKQNDI